MYLAHAFLGFTFRCIATADRTDPASPAEADCGITVIPRLTKIIRSGITFVCRNVISRRFL